MLTFCFSVSPAPQDENIRQDWVMQHSTRWKHEQVGVQWECSSKGTETDASTETEIMPCFYVCCKSFASKGTPVLKLKYCNVFYGSIWAGRKCI